MRSGAAEAAKKACGDAVSGRSARTHHVSGGGPSSRKHAARASSGRHGKDSRAEKPRAAYRTAGAAGAKTLGNLARSQNTGARHQRSERGNRWRRVADRIAGDARKPGVRARRLLPAPRRAARPPLAAVRARDGARRRAADLRERRGRRRRSRSTSRRRSRSRRAGSPGTRWPSCPTTDGAEPETGGGRIMMNLVARTAASGDASHADTVFVIDDDGVWLLRRPQDSPADSGSRSWSSSRAREADRAVRGRARPHRRRPRRASRATCATCCSLNKWSANRPGTTYFLPIAELTAFDDQHRPDPLRRGLLVLRPRRAELVPAGRDRALRPLEGRAARRRPARRPRAHARDARERSCSSSRRSSRAGSCRTSG